MEKLAGPLNMLLIQNTASETSKTMVTFMGHSLMMTGYRGHLILPPKLELAISQIIRSALI